MARYGFRRRRFAVEVFNSANPEKVLGTYPDIRGAKAKIAQLSAKNKTERKPVVGVVDPTTLSGKPNYEVLTPNRPEGP